MKRFVPPSGRSAQPNVFKVEALEKWNRTINTKDMTLQTTTLLVYREGNGA